MKIIFSLYKNGALNMDANWHNVLLTDSGFYFSNKLNQPNAPLIDRLRDMVGKPFEKTTVLLIPTAAMQNEAKAEAITHRLRDELLAMDFQPYNIMIHDIDGSLSEADVLQYDVMYITGGKTPYLAQRTREAGFDALIRAFIAANKVYIGMSAGSMLLTPHFNQDDPNNPDFAGLGIFNAYLSVHNAADTPHRNDLPLPHIALQENQAIAVTHDSYEVIGGINADGETLRGVHSSNVKPLRFVAATTEQRHHVTDLLCTLYEMPQDEVLKENERLFADKNHAFFLALDGDKAVGVAHGSLRHEYVNGTDDGVKGYLEGIFVLPEYRKRGIADELVRTAERWMAQQGCRQIASDCHIDNTDSYDFHRKIGFVETERCIFFVKTIAPSL